MITIVILPKAVSKRENALFLWANVKSSLMPTVNEVHRAKKMENAQNAKVFAK